MLLANGFAVALAVTRLLYLRGACLARVKKVLGYSPRRIGEAWKVELGALELNPASCYETFVSTYLQRTAALLQVGAERQRFPLPRHWPRLHAHLWDAVTFRGDADFREWQAESRATFEQPNYLYAVRQLRSLARSLTQGVATREEPTARELDLDRPHVA